MKFLVLLLFDFEIFLLLIEYKIKSANFLFADYFINGNNILIIIKDFGNSFILKLENIIMIKVFILNIFWMI